MKAAGLESNASKNILTDPTRPTVGDEMLTVKNGEPCSVTALRLVLRMVILCGTILFPGHATSELVLEARSLATGVAFGCK